MRMLSDAGDSDVAAVCGCAEGVPAGSAVTAAGGSNVDVLAGTTVGAGRVSVSCREVSVVDVSAAGGTAIDDSSGFGETDVEETGGESEGESAGEEIVGVVGGAETVGDVTVGEGTGGEETGEVSALVAGEPAMMVSGGSTG